MGNLNKVVYLTNAQAQELFTNGTITVDGVTVTYSADDLYVTPSGEVTDVQVNGASIVSNGVANIPKASTSAIGLAKASMTGGTSALSDGSIIINATNWLQLKKGTNGYNPVVPVNTPSAVFYGLARAAGDTTQDSQTSDSVNSMPNYTEDAKFAIAEMLGLSYEKLLYRDDTFGNIWTEYQPVDIDYTNNTITLSDATGISTEITAAGSANLVLKPLPTLQYGTIPTELYGVNRVKNIGNNKIEFYNSSGELVQFTDSTCVDLTKCKLLYRPNVVQPNRPAFRDIPAGHKIHAKFTYYGYLGAAAGLRALDMDGNAIRSVSYGLSDTRRSASIAYNFSGNTSVGGLTDMDGYACILGRRAIDYRCPNNASTFGEYEIWFWDDPLIGGSKYEVQFTVYTSETNAKTKQFLPSYGHGFGYTSVPIAGLDFSTNSGNEWTGPGSKFEIWDCGTNFN